MKNLKYLFFILSGYSFISIFIDGIMLIHLSGYMNMSIYFLIAGIYCDSKIKKESDKNEN